MLGKDTPPQKKNESNELNSNNSNEGNYKDTLNMLYQSLASNNNNNNNNSNNNSSNTNMHKATPNERRANQLRKSQDEFLRGLLERQKNQSARIIQSASKRHLTIIKNEIKKEKTELIIQNAAK